MTGLTYDQFAEKPGTTFRIVSGDSEPVSLILRAVEPLNDSGRVGGSFRLEFVGPTARYLPQATYPFAEDGGDAVDIFIVPIAAEADGLVYEAVFY